jgi:hypothetical protein
MLMRKQCYMYQRQQIATQLTMRSSQTGEQMSLAVTVSNGMARTLVAAAQVAAQIIHHHNTGRGFCSLAGSHPAGDQSFAKDSSEANNGDQSSSTDGEAPNPFFLSGYSRHKRRRLCWPSVLRIGAARKFARTETNLRMLARGYRNSRRFSSSFRDKRHLFICRRW